MTAAPEPDDDDLIRCPKCGARLLYWQLLDHQRDRCRYVRCDDPACRARKTPRTLQEALAAVEHWKSHAYLAGCSHGR